MALRAADLLAIGEPAGETLHHVDSEVSRDPREIPDDALVDVGTIRVRDAVRNRNEAPAAVVDMRRAGRVPKGGGDRRRAQRDECHRGDYAGDPCPTTLPGPHHSHLR